MRMRTIWHRRTCLDAVSPRDHNIRGSKMTVIARTNPLLANIQNAYKEEQNTTSSNLISKISETIKRFFSFGSSSKKEKPDVLNKDHKKFNPLKEKLVKLYEDQYKNDRSTDPERFANAISMVLRMHGVEDRKGSLSEAVLEEITKTKSSNNDDLGIDDVDLSTLEEKDFEKIPEIPLALEMSIHARLRKLAELGVDRHSMLARIQNAVTFDANLDNTDIGREKNTKEKATLWNEILEEVNKFKDKEKQYDRLPPYLGERVRPYIERLHDLGYDRRIVIDMIEKYDELGESLKININDHSAEARALFKEIGEEIQEYAMVLKDEFYVGPRELQRSLGGDNLVALQHDNSVSLEEDISVELKDDNSVSPSDNELKQLDGYEEF